MWRGTGAEMLSVMETMQEEDWADDDFINRVCGCGKFAPPPPPRPGPYRWASSPSLRWEHFSTLTTPRHSLSLRPKALTGTIIDPRRTTQEDLSALSWFLFQETLIPCWWASAIHRRVWGFARAENDISIIDFTNSMNSHLYSSLPQSLQVCVENKKKHLCCMYSEIILLFHLHFLVALQEVVAWKCETNMGIKCSALKEQIPDVCILWYNSNLISHRRKTAVMLCCPVTRMISTLAF